MKVVEVKEDKLNNFMDSQTEVAPKIVLETENSKIHMAEASGKFYNSFLDAYLTNGLPENRNPQIAQLVEILPSHTRKLYGEGIKRYQAELVANHELLVPQRGKEVQYLLGAVLNSEGRPESEVSEILSRATPDKARFVEPSPGVAIIEAEKDFFGYLQEKGLIHADGGAVNFASDNRGEPSFMMVRRMSLEKSLTEEGTSASQKSSARHEFHHFVWNFLERSKFVREASDVTPGLAKAFKHFRDELSAYTIEGRALNTIEPELLAYTEDKDILQKARDVRNYAAICMKISKRLGVDPQTFLYASMTSRNFDELRTNFGNLTPLEGDANQEVVDALYQEWSQNSTLEKQFKELLHQKGVTISPKTLSQYNHSRLSSPEHTRVRDLHYEVDRLNGFASVTESSQVEEDALRNTLRDRLQLPDSTIEVILAFPRDASGEVPLTNIPEDFVKGFVSFWRINDESARNTYSQVLASSPAIRDAFEKLKDDIAKRGAEEYRKEMSNPDRKEKTESEIRERTNVLLSL